MKTIELEKIKIFNQIGTRVSQPLISIIKSGVAVMNARFIAEMQGDLEGKTHVILMFAKDENGGAILLDFIEDSNRPGAVKLTRDKSITFAIKSFLNFNDIPLNKAEGRYPPELVNVPKMGKYWTIFLGKSLVQNKK